MNSFLVELVLVGMDLDARNNKKALARCRELIETLPRVGVIRNQEGIAAFQTRHIVGIKASLGSFEQAVDADPDQRVFKENLLVVLEQLGRHIEARRVRAVLVASPTSSFFEAVRRLCDLVALEKVDDAIALIEWISTILPLASRGYNELGCNAIREGRTREGAAFFRQAVARQPEGAQYNENLAGVLESNGVAAEAQSIRRLISTPPFLTSRVSVTDDLTSWAMASGYETRGYRQRPFELPKRLNEFPAIYRDLALQQVEDSHKPGLAVCAEGMKLVYWRWPPPSQGPDGSHKLFPVSRGNHILFPPTLLYAFPFFSNVNSGGSQCTLDATPFVTAHRKISGECFFLGGIPEFSDWLAGEFPKLEALFACDLPPNIPIVTIRLKEWMRDSLAQLGLLDRIIELDPPSPTPSCVLVEFERAWIAGDVAMPQRLEFLRKSFAKPVENDIAGVRKLYLRSPPSHHGSERIANEGEVRDFLTRRGFSEVYPESLNFEEKARLFGSADIIVSGPGSRSFNYLAFARRGCILVLPIAGSLIDTIKVESNSYGWPSWNIPYLDETILVVGQLTVDVSSDPIQHFNAPAYYSLSKLELAIDQAEEIIKNFTIPGSIRKMLLQN